MNVERLTVYEWPARTAMESQQNLGSDVLNVQTCQRSLTISLSSSLASESSSKRFFSSTDAYAFLVRFASGLESAVLGESDVFGQFKLARKEFQDQNPTSKLNLILQKVLEDSKDIRAEYLQNIGSGNYGSLARKLLKPENEQSVLCVGAGAMAQAISPYFANCNLTFWNRTLSNAEVLAEKLVRKDYVKPKLSSGSLADLTDSYDLVLILIPHSTEVSDFIARTTSPIFHGGANRKDLLPHIKNRNTAIYCLDDVFELDQTNQAARKEAVERALQAIRERALLRSLGRTLTQSHGWEDLALFAQ